MFRFYFKIYFFRDAVPAEDGGQFHSRKLTNDSIDAGADLENLRNVFFQKRPINYNLCSNTLGYAIPSNQGKMTRTFTCDNTAKTKVN